MLSQKKKSIPISRRMAIQAVSGSAQGRGVGADIKLHVYLIIRRGFEYPKIGSKNGASELF